MVTQIAESVIQIDKSVAIVTHDLGNTLNSAKLTWGFTVATFRLNFILMGVTALEQIGVTDRHTGRS